MFLSMIPTNGDLIVGTGLPGRVYLVEPGTERYIALLRDDPAFFSAAAQADDAYWVGTSRPASLVRILARLHQRRRVHLAPAGCEPDRPVGQDSAAT